MSRPSPPIASALLPALVSLTLSLGGCADHDAPASSARVPDANVPPPASATASPFADLSADTLVAPAVPVLDVRAESGALRFGWTPPPPGTRSTTLVVHDGDDGTETLVAEIAPDRHGYRLPVVPHRLRWDALSWRVEHCAPAGGRLRGATARAAGGATACVSSRRTTASGLAATTFAPLAPAVAIADERFGERVALNAGGSLLAVARPVEGRVELHHAGSDGVAAGDSLPRLGDAASTTRALDVALSASGDTVAVLSGDAARGEPPRVVVFERLGEGWLESGAFAAFAGAAPRMGAGAARPRVLLSDDGSRLVAACTGASGCPLAVHERGAFGWRAASALAAPDGAATTRAIAGSATLARVALVTARTPDAAPRLHLHDADARWRASDPIALSALAVDAPVAIALDASGERVVVGGLEPARGGSRTPVLRQHRITRAGDALALDTEAAGRFGGPADGRVSSLSLAADGTLGTLALGWTTAHEAALRIDVRRGDGWVPALHLPDAAGRFAKRRFGSALALAADGTTLAFDVPDAAASRSGDPSADESAARPDVAGRLRAGHVLLLRSRGVATTLED